MLLLSFFAGFSAEAHPEKEAEPRECRRNFSALVVNYSIRQLGLTGEKIRRELVVVERVVGVVEVREAEHRVRYSSWCQQAGTAKLVRQSWTSGGKEVEW